MADQQVPADAVQQAQVVLQNQAQEGQAPAALAEQAQAPVAPEEQAQPPAQAPVQANEVSLEVCETFILSVSLPRVSFWFFSILLPNLVGSLPYASCFSFPLSILFALLLNVCPLF